MRKFSHLMLAASLLGAIAAPAMANTTAAVHNGTLKPARHLRHVAATTSTTDTARTPAAPASVTASVKPGDVKPGTVKPADVKPGAAATTTTTTAAAPRITPAAPVAPAPVKPN